MARLFWAFATVAIFGHCAQVQELPQNGSETAAVTVVSASPEITPYSGAPTYLADVKPILENRSCMNCHGASVFETYCTQNLDGQGLVRDNFQGLRQHAIDRRHRWLNPDTLTAIDRGLLIKWAEDGFP